MKVLVTGAGSLLLGGVAATLAARGDEVVCLQRRQLALPDGVRQVQGDVRNADVVRAAADGCDAILHGAARVGVLGTWDDFRSVNVDGTTNVLSAARANGIARVVHVSTPSVAHSGHSLVGVGAEAAVIGRKGAFYAESKAVAEQVALAANDDHLAVVAIRPHLVWGPGDTQLVGRIVERAAAGRLVMVGDGSALVDTTYIDNAISAHVAALDGVRPGARCAGRAYVVANGEPRTVRELVEGICLAAGVPFAPRHVPVGVAVRVGAVVEKLWPKFRDGEPPITRFVAEQLSTAHWFDPRPMRDDLGWSPNVSLDEGFARLREWFANAR
ncbi:MAG: NAD-dependent epimerase/dehydratase family protein [Actinomycetota bacterium]